MKSFALQMRVLSCVGFALLLAPATAVKPEPVSLPVDTTWLGYDGNWSPITIRVGTPPQWVYVLPNVLSQEVWVIGPGGCDGTYTCETKRGGTFEYNQSSSWQGLGPYELGFDLDLGDSGGADYGYDDVALDQETIAPGQIVGIMNSTEFWTGYLGLGVQPTDFTNTNRLTFLSSLVENQSLVPSHSYGYTAGAYYRLKGVPASLTFGGVDTNRFTPNDCNFTLNSDQQPVVAINQITLSADPDPDCASKPNWTSPLTLTGSSDAALYTIDSSTPFLWLPDDVCDAFADALGLFYNETLQLYTFEGNSTSQEQLPGWNMNFKFTIADLPGSSNLVDLVLPYDAFNLQLTYPFPNLDANYTSPPMNYFPLRRAGNSSQYTIGRMFLQETYLTVDYERNNFSLSQALFSLDAATDMNIVEITRPKDSLFTGPHVPSSSGLSTGAKVGIAVGVVVGVLLLIVAGLFIFFTLRRKADPDNEKPPSRKSFFRQLSSFASTATTLKPSPVLELPATSRHPTEIPADRTTARFELAGAPPVEMEGSTVPSTCYSAETHGSQSELALNRRSSISKWPEGLPQPPSGIHQRQSSYVSDLPRYSPTTVPHPDQILPHAQSTSDVSPNSPTNSADRNFDNIMSSGEQGISPTTAYGPRSPRDGSGSEDLSPVSPSTPGSGAAAAFLGSGSTSSGSTGSRRPRSNLRTSTTRIPTTGTFLNVPGSGSSNNGEGNVSRSISSRSSRFREEGIDPTDLPLHHSPSDVGRGRTGGLGTAAAPPAGAILGDDSGYRVREPGEEQRRVSRLTRLMRRPSANEGHQQQQQQNRRFSWEEDGGEPF